MSPAKRVAATAAKSTTTTVPTPDREPETPAPAGWPMLGGTRPKLTREQAAALRAPFPAEQIGKLPRITCKACSKGQCESHKRQRCDECGNWISTQHIHLDYVGHAAVTSRLLEVDPEWNWEPVPNSEDLGLPTPPGTMWIRLTVCDVERFGIGDAQGKTGPDAVKEMIGDALRNAAMRFGVALDLWMKERHASVEQPSSRSGSSRSGGQPPSKRAANRAAPAKKSAGQRPALDMPTGSLADIRAELHARLKAIPGAAGARAMEQFADKFGDPNELGAGKVANAVAFIAAQVKVAESAPAAADEPETSEDVTEPTPADQVRDALTRDALTRVVGDLDNDELQAMYDAMEEAQPTERRAAQAGMVELMLPEALAAFPEGATYDDVSDWFNSPPADES